MDFPVSQPDVGLVGGVFVDENAVTGQPGSRIPATWGNAVTKELLNVLQEVGIEPDESDTGQVAAAILKMISEAGGMPRFTPYVWGGRGDAMPEGDTQSSGQQLLDLMYPDMRADVVATQFTCTEAEWQADPYKRVTHWSLGDGVSWMRPPDKNGVQPGNVGSFYGAGSNPAGAKTGTAVIDAMRNLSGSIEVGVASSNAAAGLTSGSGVFGSSGITGKGTSAPSLGGSVTGSYFSMYFEAAGALPAGTTTDPVTGEFRPRTWYGIWMIRMYGRVVNPGALDAPALNARMDMMDARVATCESNLVKLPVGANWMDKTAVRALNTTYTNSNPYEIEVAYVVASTAPSVAFQVEVMVDGARLLLTNSYAATAQTGDGATFSVPAGKTYRLQNATNCILSKWQEKVKV